MDYITYLNNFLSLYTFKTENIKNKHVISNLLWYLQKNNPEKTEKTVDIYDLPLPKEFIEFLWSHYIKAIPLPVHTILFPDKVNYPVPKETLALIEHVFLRERHLILNLDGLLHLISKLDPFLYEKLNLIKE